MPESTRTPPPEISHGKHILLTGGCGFIGSNFVRFVLEHRPNDRITNLDCLSYAGNLENLADLAGGARYRFVKGDVRDRELVGELVAACDAVVHMAAESHVDRSLMDCRPFIETNVVGTQTLLDALRRQEGKRLVHVSTDEVYGSLPLDRPDLKFTETSPLAPTSPYAASKAASDLLVLSYCQCFGLDAVVTRCSNNFGPYQFPEKVIPLFVTNLLEGKPAPLYGDGGNVRDWIHVDDHCEALLALLERGRRGEVYNIGADNERSNLELTRAVLDIMGQSDSMIQRVTDRAAHDRRYAIDAGKIGSELGWSASRSAWPQALAATVRWYIEHPAWWQNVKSGGFRHYYDLQYGKR